MEFCTTGLWSSPCLLLMFVRIKVIFITSKWFYYFCLVKVNDCPHMTLSLPILILNKLH